MFNPDARLDQKIIEPLINLNLNTKGLVGPVIKDFYTGKVQSIGGTFNPLFTFLYSKKNLQEKIYKVEWILGASILISKEIIKKCGFLMRISSAS